MRRKLILFRIFIIASATATIVVAVKYLFHYFEWDPIEQSSLHNGVLSSATFVIGFLLSATIADYKESERIPPEFAANIEDMYTDAETIHTRYPDFDLEGFRNQLLKITQKFSAKVRQNDRGVSDNIRALHTYFGQMEQADVPANFIIKLKQQQLLLLRHRKRLTYIQRIRFIPSATILSRSIVVLVIGLLIFTNVDPFYGSLAIIGIISFVLVYMMVLINVISTPFHAEGKTQDDVSMFLLQDAARFLKSKKKV
jgi:MFS family permease